MKREKQIKKILDKLYPDPAIPLIHKDPYTLLIAVLLSAQCTDQRVNKITPLLFKKASTPETMSRLPLRKSRRLFAPAASRLRNQKQSGSFQGCFSKSMEVMSRPPLKNSKRCPASDTKQPP